MSVKLKVYQLGQAMKDLKKAQEAALDALCDVAEAEMAELALRFPTRRLHLSSGMGSTTLFIDRRTTDQNSYMFDRSETFERMPDWFAQPLKALWKAMTFFEAESGDRRDPGFGSIIYENGKRISGLT